MVVIGMSEYGSDSLRPGKEKGPDLRVCFDGSGFLSLPVRWRETASMGVSVSQGAVEGRTKAIHGRCEDLAGGCFPSNFD